MEMAEKNTMAYKEEVEPASPRGQGAESSTTESSTSSTSFITHKVSSRDTLAGIAIRYNVSVADIKRANGLLSDSAMYALDSIMIPTRLIPVGEELQVIFAQVASGFGRDPILNAESNLLPASAAVARVARTLHIVNGEHYPADVPVELSWLTTCGACQQEDVIYGPSGYRSRRRTSSGGEPGEVELMERNAQDATFIGHSPEAGPTRMHERMRRRRGTYTMSGEDGWEDGPGGTQSDGDAGHQAHEHMRHGHSQLQGTGYQQAPSFFGIAGSSQRPYSGGRPPPPGIGPGSGEMAAATQHFMKQLAGIGKALGESSLVQKLRAVASQPALAAPNTQSLAQAAEGVLGSFKDGLKQSRGSSSGAGSGVPLLPRSFTALGGGSSSGATKAQHKAIGKAD